MRIGTFKISSHHHATVGFPIEAEQQLQLVTVEATWPVRVYVLDVMNLYVFQNGKRESIQVIGFSDSAYSHAFLVRSPKEVPWAVAIENRNDRLVPVAYAVESMTDILE